MHIVSRAGEQNGTESDTAATGADTPDGLMPAPPLPQVHSPFWGCVLSFQVHYLYALQCEYSAPEYVGI